MVGACRSYAAYSLPIDGHASCTGAGQAPTRAPEAVPYDHVQGHFEGCWHGADCEQLARSGTGQGGLAPDGEGVATRNARGWQAHTCLPSQSGKKWAHCVIRGLQSVRPSARQPARAYGFYMHNVCVPILIFFGHYWDCRIGTNCNCNCLGALSSLSVGYKGWWVTQ